MQPKPRANQRVELVGGVLRVSLIGDAAGILEGDACNVSAGGAGVHLPTERLPSLRIGQETVLSFHRPGSNQHLTTRAILRHSMALEGCMHYGFEFVQPERIRSQIKSQHRQQLCTLFNARGMARVAPPGDRPMMAVLAKDAERGSALVRVVDLSGSGAAVEQEAAVLVPLAAAQSLQLTLPSLLDGKPLAFACSPRCSRDVEGLRHLGLEFDAERTEVFEEKQKAVVAYCEALQAQYLDRAVA